MLARAAPVLLLAGLASAGRPLPADPVPPLRGMSTLGAHGTRAHARGAQSLQGCDSSLGWCNSGSAGCSDMTSNGYPCNAMAESYGCDALINQYNYRTCLECTCSPDNWDPNAPPPPPAPTGKCSGQSGTCYTMPSEAQKQAIIDMHNMYREKHGACPVTWDQAIADWTMDSTGMRQTCTSGSLTHNSGMPYGENIAMAGDGKDIHEWAAESGVTNWYCGEEGCYDYNSPGFSSGTGHFTQVVWKTSTVIGCALCQINNGGLINKYLMCNYKEAGNMGGAFPANVLRPNTAPSGCAGAPPPTPAPATPVPPTPVPPTPAPATPPPTTPATPPPTTPATPPPMTPATPPPMTPATPPPMTPATPPPTTPGVEPPTAPPTGPAMPSVAPTTSPTRPGTVGTAAPTGSTVPGASTPPPGPETAGGVAPRGTVLCVQLTERQCEPTADGHCKLTASYRAAVGAAVRRETGAGDGVSVGVVGTCHTGQADCPRGCGMTVVTNSTDVKGRLGGCRTDPASCKDMESVGVVSPSADDAAADDDDDGFPWWGVLLIVLGVLCLAATAFAATRKKKSEPERNDAPTVEEFNSMVDQTEMASVKGASSPPAHGNYSAPQMSMASQPASFRNLGQGQSSMPVTFGSPPSAPSYSVQSSGAAGHRV